MPINQMNVGTDYSFSVYNGTSGTLQDFGNIENIKINGQAHELKVTPYNGPPLFGFASDGYHITFEIARSDSSLEDYQVAYDALFNSGGLFAPGFFNQTINNPDGTVSMYQYTNFVFRLDSHGDVSREKPVKLSVIGRASEKISLAGAMT